LPAARLWSSAAALRSCEEIGGQSTAPYKSTLILRDF
jgi:hypothetical protein